MKHTIQLLLVLICITASVAAQKNTRTGSAERSTGPVIRKAESEWKKILSPLAFQVMVKRGTEPPYRNAYHDNHQKGIYVSAATGEPLFSSEDKYDSGTGWPSFTKPINTRSVAVVSDRTHGMVRDEVVEAKTGLHLGHVFDDGPKNKGGKRYCMNSAALKFVKQ